MAQGRVGPVVIVMGKRSGIGLASARAFAQRGLEVFITALDAKTLRRISREIACSTPFDQSHIHCTPLKQTGITAEVAAAALLHTHDATAILMGATVASHARRGDAGPT